jgi:hypothetical protein
MKAPAAHEAELEVPHPSRLLCCRQLDEGGTMVGPIELTEPEREPLEQIQFPPYPVGGDNEALRDSIEPGYELLQSLLARDAIPAVG